MFTRGCSLTLSCSCSKLSASCCQFFFQRIRLLDDHCHRFIQHTSAASLDFLSFIFIQKKYPATGQTVFGSFFSCEHFVRSYNQLSCDMTGEVISGFSSSTSIIMEVILVCGNMDICVFTSVPAHYILNRKADIKYWCNFIFHSISSLFHIGKRPFNSLSS